MAHFSIRFPVSRQIDRSASFNRATTESLVIIMSGRSYGHDFICSAKNMKDKKIAA
eukprot:COSAG01_NODE_789_length_13572_cov_322.875158_7_plen_56_part_00